MMRTIATLALALAVPAVQASTVEELFRGLAEKHRHGGKPIPGLPAQSAPEITRPTIADRLDGLNLAREQIAVIVGPGCRSCSAAVTRLRQRGFGVEVLDLGTNPIAREAYRLSGASGVPTVLFGRRMLGGWSDKQFDRLLKDEMLQKGEEQRGTGA